MGTEPTESTGQPPFIVDMSVSFARIYARLPANESQPIDDLIDHVEAKGLTGLPGRLKKSDDINPSTAGWLAKVNFVRTFNLYHYHAGFPVWDLSRPHGDYTSEWVIQMMLSPCGYRTTLVTWNKHPPFELPKPHELLMPGQTLDDLPKF